MVHCTTHRPYCSYERLLPYLNGRPLLSNNHGSSPHWPPVPRRGDPSQFLCALECLQHTVRPRVGSSEDLLCLSEPTCAAYSSAGPAWAARSTVVRPGPASCAYDYAWFSMLGCFMSHGFRVLC